MKNLYILSILIIFYGCGSNQIEDDKNISQQNKQTKESSVDKSIDNFLLTNSRGREINISIKDDMFFVKDIKESIVLINIFASWCKPCMGQIPYLAEIQKRENRDVLIIGLSVYDNKTPKELDSIFQNSSIRYFISTSKDNQLLVDKLLKQLKLAKNFNIPMSIIYRDGKLFRYYKGAIPMEMLQVEIKNAKKLL